MGPICGGSKNLRLGGLVLDSPIGLIQRRIAEAIDSRWGETHLGDAVLLESLIFRVTAAGPGGYISSIARQSSGF